MKKHNTGILFLGFLLLFTSPTFCQIEGQNEVEREQILDAVRSMISQAGTCALITLDENHLPMVRAMDAFEPESDFTVWFGTNPRSRKVAQIRNNPVVTLYYLGPENSGYVVIHGLAELVDDQNEKNSRWKDEWEAFYSNQTSDYILIKVSPITMEVVSYPHGLLGDSLTWKAPSVNFERD